MAPLSRTPQEAAHLAPISNARRHRTLCHGRCSRTRCRRCPNGLAAAAVEGCARRQLHGGVYFMYFSAYRASDNKTACIGVATSSNATGPFDGEPDPIVCDDRRGCAMDPRSYDAADGSLYLYYGSHHDPIMALRLDARLATATPPRMRPWRCRRCGPTHRRTANWWRRPGPTRMRRARSRCSTRAPQCCGADAHYAVMAARSLESASDPRWWTAAAAAAAAGPWTKLGGPDGSQSVILEAARRGRSPRRGTAPWCATTRASIASCTTPWRAPAKCLGVLPARTLHRPPLLQPLVGWHVRHRLWTAGPTSNEREAPRFF